jgi:hypothetical protein
MPDFVAAVSWLVRNGAGRETELGKNYAVRSGRCFMCNRKLTTPGSVHFGYGPDCAQQNGLPWDANPQGATAVAMAEEVASAASAKIGWQTVKANPVSVAFKPTRTYADIFGTNDDPR